MATTLETILKERKKLEEITAISNRASQAGYDRATLESFMNYNGTDRNNRGEFEQAYALNDRQLEDQIKSHEQREREEIYEKVLALGYSNVLAEVKDTNTLFRLAISTIAKKSGNKKHDELVKKVEKYQEMKQQIDNGDFTPYLKSLEKRPRVYDMMTKYGTERLKIAAQSYLDIQEKELAKEFADGDKLSEDKLKRYVSSNERKYEVGEKVDLYARTTLAIPKPGKKK